MKTIMLLVAIIVVTGIPFNAAADFYKYYDESGSVNITNDYKSIPEKYRVNVIVVKEKELEERAKKRERQERSDSGASSQKQRANPQTSAPIQSLPVETASGATSTKAELATSSTQPNGWLDRQLPLLKIIGLIALMVTAFVVIGRLVSSFAPRPLAIIIRIAMLAAMMSFLVKGYSEKISDAFSRIKDEANVAQKAVDKRSDKIQKITE